jgi:thiamine-phosphate pyrophosphorylase
MTRAAATVRGLYAIADTGYLDPSRLLAATEQALAGGARVVQYRDKSNDGVRRLHQARALAALCRVHSAMFLINDDVALTLAVRADGVHLGRDDMPLSQARAALGPDAIIGLSCYADLPRARGAVTQSADYVAFGSFFPSHTKPNAVRAPLELLSAARAELAVPVVAIGGITPENAAAAIHAGADAVAVIEGVFAADDVAIAAARYARLFSDARGGGALQ